MNIKKEVVNNINSFFQKELKKLESEIMKNKNEIKSLVSKQQVLKRSKAELDKIRREFFNPNTKDKL